MEARLYADEQLDVRVVYFLRRPHGHDVEAARETSVDKSGDGLSDKTVLEYAIAHRRIVVTDNIRDFRELHAIIPWHYGIVACPVYIEPKAKAQAIHDVLKETFATHGSFTGRWMRIPSEESDNLATVE